MLSGAEIRFANELSCCLLTISSESDMMERGCVLDPLWIAAPSALWSEILVNSNYRIGCGVRKTGTAKTNNEC